MNKELPSPSKISLLLNVPHKKLDEVVYFVNYIVVNNNGSKHFNTKDIINLQDAADSEINRKKLYAILTDIKKQVVSGSTDELKVNEFLSRIQNTNLPYSIESLYKIINKYTGIEFGIGAEAIKKLLENINLQTELAAIKNDLRNNQNTTSPIFKKLTKRYETVY
jgi:DNA-directed RNA polymerase subunit beta'